jgi:hypothetical protein
MADTSALEESKIFKRLADEKDLWWAVVSLDHSSGKPKPTVSAQGGTTIEDMMTHLSDEQLQFGCFKVLGVDTKGAIVSTRTKFVCFQVRLRPGLPSLCSQPGSRSFHRLPAGRRCAQHF